jgi:WhiB family transcriptional regulator, redox-sensing transcriptional regulator
VTQVIADQGIDWRHRSACRDEDPELFHPVGPGGPVLSEIAAAKAVCAVCPVTSECLEWALAMGVSGIWGGTSENERREMRKRAAASGGSTTGEAMSA